MKESSITRHSSFIGSLSMMKCRLLLLKIPRPSVPIHRGRRDETFYSQCSQGLSPHKITISSIFLHLFCHVTFSCWFRTILLRSAGWVWFSTGSSYTSSSRYTTIVGAPLSNFSNCVPSLANNTNFHCCVHLSNERGGVTVGFSQKASIWRGVLRISTADCAMLCLLAVLLDNWVYGCVFISLPEQLRCDCRTWVNELESQFRNFLFIGHFYSTHSNREARFGLITDFHNQKNL